MAQCLAVGLAKELDGEPAASGKKAEYILLLLAHLYNYKVTILMRGFQHVLKLQYSPGFTVDEKPFFFYFNYSRNGYSVRQSCLDCEIMG